MTSQSPQTQTPLPSKKPIPHYNHPKLPSQLSRPQKPSLTSTPPPKRLTAIQSHNLAQSLKKSKSRSNSPSQVHKLLIFQFFMVSYFRIKLSPIEFTCSHSSQYQCDPYYVLLGFQVSLLFLSIFSMYMHWAADGYLRHIDGDQIDNWVFKAFLMTMLWPSLLVGYYVRNQVMEKQNPVGMLYLILFIVTLVFYNLVLLVKISMSQWQDWELVQRILEIEKEQAEKEQAEKEQVRDDKGGLGQGKVKVE